jgi:Domain of unknown function (DUF362)
LSTSEFLERDVLASSVVAIATNLDGSNERLLARALDESGFWGVLERATLRSGKPMAEFSILIKPDLDYLSGDRPSFTDPGLVEHMMDMLHERGWPQVSLGVLPDPIFRPIQNRDPLLLADLAGYRFVTPEGHGYPVEDLASNWISIDPDAEFSGRSPRVAAAWLDADFRICFPRFRTDPGSGYKLALNSLVHLLAFDPVGRGASRVEDYDKMVCVLRRIPPQFVILDALGSCLGLDGMLRPATMPTMTIIAGEAPVLVDWVAASKAGLSATVSPLMRAAQRACAPSGPFTIVGDIRPFFMPPVDGRHTASDVPVYEERFARLARLLTSDLDFDLFPPEGLVLADLAGRLKRLTLLVPAPALVDTLHAFGRYYDRALFLYGRFLDTSRLTRRHFGLNVPHDVIGESVFTALRALTAPLASRLQALSDDSEVEQLETTPNGDFVAVYTQNVAIDCDDFLDQFDVARSMTYLNGYLGGSAIPLATNERGRVMRQLERTVYLSQPAFLSWFGSDSIDVTKIEEFERADDRETIYWHTLASENQSARADDGVLSVRRRADGLLRIEIAVRQQLSVPLPLRFMEAPPFDSARMSLARESYRTFFRNTIANFEAVYEGRDPLVGRWPDSSERDTAVVRVEQLVKRGVELIARLARERHDPAQHSRVPRNFRSHDGQAYDESTDARGFRHFRAAEAGPQ